MLTISHLSGGGTDYVEPHIALLRGSKTCHYKKYTFDALSGINGILENIISGTDELLDINILNQIDKSNQDFSDINAQLEEIIRGGSTTSNLITFTVDGVSYQAEEGMTWGEWCNSEYNTSSDIRVVYTGTKYIIKQGVFNNISEDNWTVIESHCVIKNNFAYIIMVNDF